MPKKHPYFSLFFDGFPRGGFTSGIPWFNWILTFGIFLISIDIQHNSLLKFLFLSLTNAFCQLTNAIWQLTNSIGKETNWIGKEKNVYWEVRKTIWEVRQWYLVPTNWFGLQTNWFWLHTNRNYSLPKLISQLTGWTIQQTNRRYSGVKNVLLQYAFLSGIKGWKTDVLWRIYLFDFWFWNYGFSNNREELIINNRTR